MIFTRFIAVSISFCVIFLVGCSSQKIKVDTDYSEFKFGSLKTFKWVTDGPKRDSRISDLVYERIESEVTKNLIGKGFKPSSDSDFLIHYSVLKDVKIDIENHMVYDYAPGFGWHSGYSYGYVLGPRQQTMETNIDQYLEGTLIIDILDSATKKVVWRGIGSKELPEQIGKKYRDNLVAEAVAAVLKNFPPTK